MKVNQHNIEIITTRDIQKKVYKARMLVYLKYKGNPLEIEG